MVAVTSGLVFSSPGSQFEPLFVLEWLSVLPCHLRASWRVAQE